jgi:DNA polymerase-3 subunit delta'
MLQYLDIVQERTGSMAAAWPVIGHEWATDLLGRAVRSGKPGHAYLFLGPQGVGKRTLASAFARALACERREGLPCGECRACQRAAQGRYPDIQVISAARNTLQIEQVRAIQADAAIAPLEGAYRVFIVREIERATAPAANALLKTLEEPPARVVLLLTAARRDQVLPTVLSRCQVFPLRPLPEEQVRSALQERWGAAADRAELLARLSGGRLGWAVSALGDEALWQERSRCLDDLLLLSTQDAYDRLRYAEALSRGDDGFEPALGHWATWWRDVLLVQSGLAAQVLNTDRRAQLHQQAELFRPAQVEAALADLVRTARRVRANVNPRLALDVLLLRLPRPAVA